MLKRPVQVDTASLAILDLLGIGAAGLRTCNHGGLSIYF